MDSGERLHFAGVDFGGTAAKIGVVDDRGSLLARGRVEIGPRDRYESIFAAVSGRIRQMSEARGVTLAAIGVGAPGFIDRREGRVLQGSENLAAFKGRSLTAWLAAEHGVPVFADNDGSCAAAGELKFGAGRPYAHFVMLTLGSGVGGALVIDGRVHRGSRGLAGEVGHLCLDPDGPRCTCGSRGCLEQYASGPAIVAGYLRKRGQRGRHRQRGQLAPGPGGQGPGGPSLGARHVFQRAAEGEEAAREVIRETGRRLAQAIGILVNLLDLQACIIGGGVAAAGEQLLEPVRRFLPDFAWPLPLQGFQVRATALPDDAGVLGAAAQAWERLTS